VVNIGRFVAGMGDMLRRTIGEAIEIETMRAGGLWNTFIDPAQIENAILNLAINARDAMDGAGKLTIEVGNAVIDAEYARTNSDVAPGQYVMLAVTDDGSGMPPEIIAKVFEPFFSTKAPGKGTGLGLSMVYGFVKQSGGHVKIYSEVGRGTTIRIYLPRAHEAENIVAEMDFGPISGGSEIILVAEDDEGVRATVVETLGDLGYTVLKAKDAVSALSVIDSGSPIDLLFTDVIMPGPLSSSELARKARERLPHMPVLFTSGYTENSIVHGGRLDPGVELLSKPYTREALARRIRQLLDQRKQPFQAQVAMPYDVAATTQSIAPVHSAPMNILLVEDDELIRQNTADTLRDLGHDVCEVPDGYEALKQLAGGRFDLLFTDLGLPGMSGGDLAIKVREIAANIGVVFATGNDDPPLLSGRPGILLRKPYTMTDITMALRAAAR